MIPQYGPDKLVTLLRQSCLNSAYKDMSLCFPGNSVFVKVHIFAYVLPLFRKLLMKLSATDMRENRFQIESKLSSFV